MRRELTTEYQLFAENRAFALRDNFDILEDELKRLALSPQVNLTDGNLVPEQQLLSGAHQNSVLYNTAVLLLSADGTCLGSVPDRPEYRAPELRRPRLVQGGAVEQAAADLPRHRRARHRPHHQDHPAGPARRRVHRRAGRHDRARRGEPHHPGAARQPAAQDRRDADRLERADHLPARPRGGVGRLGLGARDSHRGGRWQRNADRPGRGRGSAVRLLAGRRGDQVRGRLRLAVERAQREPATTSLDAGGRPGVRCRARGRSPA